MKIGVKLIVIMIVLSLFSTGTIGFTLLVQARSNIISLANDKAITTVQEYAGDIRNFFSSYWFTVESIASVMERYENISAYNRRTFFNAILKAEVEKHKDITGIWVIWEPDVLEGNDSQYIGMPGTTSFGRFSPYWHRDGNDILMYALPENEFNAPGTGDYYHVPRRAGRTMILEPYLDDVGGKLILNTTIAAPIISRNAPGKVLGVVGIDIDINTIQKITEKHDPFGGGFTAVFSNKGTVAAHFEPERIGRPLQETEQDMAGPYLNDLLDAVINGKLFYFTNSIGGLNTDYTIYVTPIQIGNNNDNWSYAIAVPLKTVLRAVNQMLDIVIIISIIVLTLVIFVAVFLSRSILRPIIRVTDTLKDISEGEGDLSRSIAINSNDEVGKLSHYFNQTVEKIKNLVINIKKESEILSGIGNELAGNMHETAAAMNEITSNIQNIKVRIINQSASVSETHATMENVTVNINKLNEHVESQNSHISQASAAIEQMVANIQSVTETLIKNSVNVKNLRDASDVGRRGLQEVAQDIHDITRESEGLLEINSVMENIASQTNLLSMNAAIEAAHAGEAGKGFAVVADEIRKLAESSGMQSKTIGTVLKKIKESIDKITISTKNVMNRFEAIDSSVRIVAEQEDIIRSAMEEQGTGSKQVLEGIGQVNEITRQVMNGSIEMLDGAEEVIKESTNLERVTQEITSGINEMASGAAQINTAVNHVNEISGKNRDGIDILIKEVSKFKVE